MRVRFWGTRGSIATPGPGTNRFGGNTSCVAVSTDAGACIMFDCGTGARLLGAELLAKARRPLEITILLGHTHWDHIQGFPFFAPLFVPGSRITVCGPEGSGRSLREVLAGQMEFTYFPVDLGELPARITFRELAEGTHEIGGVRIGAQFLNHPAMTLGYRVEADGAAVVYLTDHEPFSETLWHDADARGGIDAIVHEGDRRHTRFMSGAGLVIHDAQYTTEEYETKKNWGHSPYRYAVALAGVAGVRQLALTHHDPGHDDDFVEVIEQQARAFAAERGYAVEVCCAREGLDLAVEPHGPHQRAAVPLPPREHPDAAPAKHILIVDDDPDLLALASLALTRDGHAVTVVAGGMEARASIEGKQPDLVVLDLLMPHPDGIEVLRALRSNPSTAKLPIVVLTAQNDEANTRAAFDAGADDYLTKPFTMPQLAARVRACLARTSTAHGESVAETSAAGDGGRSDGTD